MRQRLGALGHSSAMPGPPLIASSRVIFASPGSPESTEAAGPAVADDTCWGQETTVGNPTGSGLSALPSEAQTQRVEGKITAIDSSRTNRIVEVGDVKLEVEPTTVVLVGCKAATVADLKVGTQIKAAYEEKAPHRQLARVIEAQN